VSYRSAPTSAVWSVTATVTLLLVCFSVTAFAQTERRLADLDLEELNIIYQDGRTLRVGLEYSWRK
jgi:hypothetical protein